MTLHCPSESLQPLENIGIGILGAHCCEARDKKCISFLINNKVLIDAGALTSSLSIEEQTRLKAVLLTHPHYDHIKDLPILALNMFRERASIDVYASPDTCNMITTHFLNGKVYPDFQNIPLEKPTIRFNAVEPYKSFSVEGLNIIALPVNHPGGSVGYQVSNSEGRGFFYTSDTGPGLANCWRSISSDLMLVDVTFPNSYQDFATKTGHLTPRLLGEELVDFRELKGYLPRIIVVHTDPDLESTIQSEIAEISGVLKIQIEMAHEGMQIAV
jgi:ribonuclease BN (tRNA processing enzyme)